MKIEIHNMNAAELNQVITHAPDGKVIVEDDKAFWETKGLKPQPQNDVRQGQVPFQQVPQQFEQAGQQDPFNRMKNSLFEAFS